jgi:hypothetical protein
MRFFGCNFLQSAETGVVTNYDFVEGAGGRLKMWTLSGRSLTVYPIPGPGKTVILGVVKVVRAHRMCGVEIEVGNDKRIVPELVNLKS